MLTLKNTCALTEKGQLKPAVRSTVAAYVASHPELFIEAVKVEGKNLYVLECHDADGHTFYVNFDVTVSTLSAADRSVKKPAAKKATTEVDVEVE